MRWRYCLLIAGSALALMVSNCSESRAVPCMDDAECVDTCTAECERRGEQLLASMCGTNSACQCVCSSSGTGGAGGGDAGVGGGGGSP